MAFLTSSIVATLTLSLANIYGNADHIKEMTTILGVMKQIPKPEQ